MQNPMQKAPIIYLIPLQNIILTHPPTRQAFHWFANMDSLREIHRVLKPHGAFGMIWNIEDYNAPRSHTATTSWEETMHDYIWSQDDSQPRFRHEKWRQVFDEQLGTGPLSLIVASEQFFALPLGEFVESWELWLPKDKVWDRLTTLSQIAVLEDGEREEVRKLFYDAIEAEDTKIDDQGRIAVHGATYSSWTTKIPAEGASKLWEKQS